MKPDVVGMLVVKATRLNRVPIWNVAGDSMLCMMDNEDVLFVSGTKKFGKTTYYVVITQDGIGIVEAHRNNNSRGRLVRCL